jgi:hypothetical protein
MNLNTRLNTAEFMFELLLVRGGTDTVMEWQAVLRIRTNFDRIRIRL